MAFGTPIDDYTQYAIGLFGYVIKIDLTAHLFEYVESIVAEYAAGQIKTPVTTEVEISTLYGYCDDIDCPDYAFNWNNGILSVFFKDDGSNVDAWAADQRFVAGDYRISAISGNDAIFKCTTGGLGEVTAGPPVVWAETGNVTDNECTWIFQKYEPIPNTYPFATTTRIAAFGKRKAQRALLDADAVDVPERDMGLVINYALRLVWNIKEKTIPKDIANIIDTEEARIRNE